MSAPRTRQRERATTGRAIPLTPARREEIDSWVEREFADFRVSRWLVIPGRAEVTT